MERNSRAKRAQAWAGSAGMVTSLEEGHQGAEELQS